MNQTLIRVIRGDYLFLLFLAEFLEARIGAQRLFPDFGDPGKLCSSSVRTFSLAGRTKTGL